MATIGDLCDSMERIAPCQLAADWDNVGLLVGDRGASCLRVMTCLTITETVVDEAVAERVDLIVTHHPLPFQPLKKITTDAIYGHYLWRLIGNGTSIYSAHTAFDSAAEGINWKIASGLGLSDIVPLSRNATLPELGEGRVGSLAQSLTAKELAQLAAKATSAGSVRIVGNSDQAIRKVAIACGSGGSFLGAAAKSGCQSFVTGEANFHSCLEAEAHGMALILVGHYASERFAMDWLAKRLQDEFTGCLIWASRSERDPVSVIQ